VLISGLHLVAEKPFWPLIRKPQGSALRTIYYNCAIYYNKVKKNLEVPESAKSLQRVYVFSI